MTTLGPWPDDEDRRGEGGDDRLEEHGAGTPPAGSKPVALTVAGISFVFPVLLPWLLVGAIYMFLSVYALIKAIGSAPDAPNATVVLLGIVGLVTTLVMGAAVGAWLIGRTADPRKRRR